MPEEKKTEEDYNELIERAAHKGGEAGGETMKRLIREAGIGQKPEDDEEEEG